MFKGTKNGGQRRKPIPDANTYSTWQLLEIMAEGNPKAYTRLASRLAYQEVIEKEEREYNTDFHKYCQSLLDANIRGVQLAVWYDIIDSTRTERIVGTIGSNDLIDMLNSRCYGSDLIDKAVYSGACEMDEMPVFTHDDAKEFCEGTKKSMFKGKVPPQNAYWGYTSSDAQKIFDEVKKEKANKGVANDDNSQAGL